MTQHLQYCDLLVLFTSAANMDLRVCIPNIAGFMDVKKPPLTGQTIMTGPMTPWSEVCNDVMRGFNMTFLPEDSIGAVIAGSNAYSGCVGLLHENRTDVMFGPLTSLIMSPNIVNVVVDGFERVGILSGYLRSNSSKDGYKTHVLDMVFAFSWQLWILITLFVFMLLMITSKAVLSKKAMRQMLWRFRKEAMVTPWHAVHDAFRSLIVITACLLKQHSSTVVSVKISFNVLYATLTYFCLMIFGFYLTSMIKTEMVVVKPPVTVESYQDILDLRRRPSWSSTLTDKDEFENGLPGSMERKVWNLAVEMGLNESIVVPAPETIMSHSRRAADFQQVMLIQSLFGEGLVPSAICSFARTKQMKDDVNVLFRYDPNAQEKFKWNIQNRGNPKWVRDKIRKRLQINFEFDRMNAAKQHVDFSSYMQITDIDKYYRKILECCSNVVKIDHPFWRPADVKHYRTLIYLLAGCIAVALSVFVHEIRSHKE